MTTAFPERKASMIPVSDKAAAVQPLYLSKDALYHKLAVVATSIMMMAVYSILLVQVLT